MHETSKDEYVVGLYDGDYILTGNIVHPFFNRGGGWNNGSGSGVFYSGDSGGNDGSYGGFRPVVIL